MNQPVAVSTDPVPLSHFKKRIEDEIEKITLRHANDNNASVEKLNGCDWHARSQVMEESVASQLMECRRLARLKDALKKFEDGTYGLCKCGKPISQERLEACPIADKCLKCLAKESKNNVFFLKTTHQGR